jgi:voltage-gated potassium channel
MARKPYRELTAAARRWAVAASLLRSLASVVLIVVIYYHLPLNDRLSPATAVRFGIGLAVFAIVMVWQVRAILRSPIPRLRAIEAISIGLPLLLLVFASTYCILVTNQPASFNEPLSRTDALYFTVTVFATVGFGDIVPTTEVARIVTTIQMVSGLIAVGVVAKVVFAAAQLAVRRRQTGDAEDPATQRAEKSEVPAPNPTSQPDPRVED